MKNVSSTISKSLVIFFLLAGVVGCDTFDELFEKEKEASGIVEEVGADYLVVEAIRYNVNENTKYDGFTGLSDITAGIEVEIEYEESGSVRVAIEIEAGSDND